LSTTNSSTLALILLTAVEPHMGTLVSIKLYAPDQAHAERAFRLAFGRIAQIDKTLSDYDPESELSRITRLAVRRQVCVSADLYRVLEMGQRIAAETDGAFDLTVGPLTHLWREARHSGIVPVAAAIAEARAHCGYRKMHLNLANHSVQFDEPGMLLDAGAIGKGYAADEALAVITRMGIAKALVAASGDLAFSGGPWRIGIDGRDETLALSGAAVSTSGDSEQHLGPYSHIIDPATGFGLVNGSRVTVIAPHGIEADALATAISVVGPARAKRLLQQHPGARRP
jgi:thiamine biosynthesis lipoprotein